MVQKSVTQKKPYKNRLVVTLLFPFGVVALGAGMLGLLIYWQLVRDLPKIISLSDYRPAGVTRIYAKDGNKDVVVGEYFTEKRFLVPVEAIPEKIVQAFLSAEDAEFFEHEGINFMAILRAAIANFRAGHVVQGGSTITQQVAKSLFLTPERSFVRKAKEFVLAGRIEENLSKNDILYLYLNQIYLGNGAYGIQAAAQAYFRKNISDLTLAEIAILAGVPRAPSRFSPLVDTKRAKERQLYVLRRMMENGFIDQETLTTAAAEQVKVFPAETINSQYAPYLVEHVRRHLIEKYGEKAVYQDGLTVYLPTTIQALRAARRGIVESLQAVDKRGGYRGPVRQLDSVEAREAFVLEARKKVIEKSSPFQIFMPDGTLAVPEPSTLVDGEIYEGLVTRIDRATSTATVDIGGIETKMTLEGMRWAWPGPRALDDPSKVLNIDMVVLARVKKAGREWLSFLEQEPIIQGALFSMELDTGYVLAMEGGYDFEKSEFNRAIQAKRQQGSAFKTIIYSLGLERGYTPASIIVDSPLVYQDDESGSWKPTNFEEKFYGDTTYRMAFVKSRNIPTIKLVQDLQVSNLVEYARRLGMTGDFQNDLSIALGSATSSLAELTGAYAVYGRQGRRVTPIFFRSVLDRDGAVLEEHAALPAVPKYAQAQSVSMEGAETTPSSLDILKATLAAYPLPDDPDQLIDPRVAYLMTHLMREVVEFGTGQRAKELARPAAGKTGTTNEYIDGWYIGFTPSVVTGAWVGYDDQRSIGQGETGAKTALPIWLTFMQDVVSAYPEKDFPIPQGVYLVPIDPETGRRRAPDHPQAVLEAFIEGTEPPEVPETSSGKQIDSGSQFLKEDLE